MTLLNDTLGNFILHEAAGYQHLLIATPLPGLPAQVNLRITTRYLLAKDPQHQREVLNLSLDAPGFDRLIGELQAIRSTL